MSAREGWTDRAVLGESERWVHVPRGGTRLENGRRLLVILPEGWGMSRVWRSWAADTRQAGELVEETVDEIKARDGGRLVWHTGDRVAPPFMDECLAGRGFEVKEELDVLAFVLQDEAGARLPGFGTPRGLEAGLVRDARVLEEVLRVDAEVFGSPPPHGGEFAEYAGELEMLGRLERGEFSGEDVQVALRFAACMDAGEAGGGGGACRVVAAAGAQLVGETLRLWGASTRRAYRGLGAYGALVRERCRFGRDLGSTLALTKANAATSSPLLRRAGFLRVGTERRYVLDLQSGSRKSGV